MGTSKIMIYSSPPVPLLEGDVGIADRGSIAGGYYNSIVISKNDRNIGYNVCGNNTRFYS